MSKIKCKPLTNTQSPKFDKYKSIYATIRELENEILKATISYKITRNSGKQRVYQCMCDKCSWKLNVMKKLESKEKFRTVASHVPVNSWYVADYVTHSDNCPNIYKPPNDNEIKQLTSQLLEMERKYEEMSKRMDATMLFIKDWTVRVLNVENEQIEQRKMLFDFHTTWKSQIVTPKLPSSGTNLKDMNGSNYSKCVSPNEILSKKPKISIDDGISRNQPPGSLSCSDTTMKVSQTPMDTDNKPERYVNKEYDLTDELESGKDAENDVAMSLVNFHDNSRLEKNPQEHYTIKKLLKELRGKNIIHDTYTKYVIQSSKTNANKKEYLNDFITWEAIETLKPSVWINDEVIDRFGQLVMRESAIDSNNSWYVIPFLVFWNCYIHGYSNVARWSKKKNLDQGRLQKLKTVIAPICLDHHWTTVVVDNFSKSFHIYDSLQANDSEWKYTEYPSDFQMVIKFLEGEYENFEIKNWKFRYKKCPSQGRNFNDCGVHVAMHILSVAWCCYLEYKQKDCSFLQKYIANCLISKKLITK